MAAAPYPSSSAQAHLTAEWVQLRRKAHAQLQQQAGQVSRSSSSQQQHPEWDSLVAALRKLREALTAAGAPPELRCEVYELSADVCAAAAGNMAELLKCLQQLHNSLYPAMVGRSASVQQASQACAHTSLQDEQPPAHTTTSSSMPCRWVEVAAALLLYFVCVPQRPVSHEIVKLLRAAAMPTACQRQRQRQQQSGQRVLLLEQPTYQLAVRATVAAMHGHWCRFLAVLHTGELPPLVKAVMRQHVWRMQLLAVQRAAVAYRMLPSETLQRWLWPASAAGCHNTDDAAAHEHVARLLQRAAAKGGSPGAAAALAQCLDEGGLLPVTLQFRSAALSKA